MIRFLLFPALTLLAFQPNSSKANFITQANTIGSWISGSGNASLSGHYGTGDGWTQGAYGSTSSGSFGGASSSASVNLSTTPGIRLSAIASSDASFGAAEVKAGASWVDTIRISGGDTPPATIRVVFEVEGRIHLSLDGGGGAYTRIGIAQSNTYNPYPIGGLIQDAAALGSGYKISEIWFVNNPSLSGFISNLNTTELMLDADTGRISWKAIFELKYLESVRGYGLNIYATNTAVGTRGSDVISNFGNTMKLTSITQLDGSDVNGQITFDSGFTIQSPSANPVPAPAGLLLGLIGSASLGLFYRVRRSHSRSESFAA